jgi:hypothetical protein
MRTTRWALGLTAALVLAGCGNASSSGAGSGPTDPTAAISPTSGTPPSSNAAPETCPYLNADQVSAAVGTDTTETAGTLHACFFDPVGGTGPSVMLSRVDVQIDPVDYAHRSRALCQGDVTDVEAGNEAFACVMGIGPQGQVYDGRVLITVNVDGAADDATGIAAASELLQEVRVPASTE